MNARPITFLFNSLVLTALVMACFGSCIRNPATRKTHARLLSPEAERKIGESTKKLILEQYSVLNSPKVSAYVNKIGQQLAEVSDRPTVDFEFTVLDNDLVNAFAAPGGFIFVTRGLLESIEDESELAMVLGHEIAHVTALHGVQMIQKEMGQNALTVLGTIGAAIVAGPEAMIVVNKSGSLFSSLYLLGYSREKELEADNLGLQYMLRAGFDPQGSLRFLQELQKGDDEEAKGWDLYFRTHPTTSERIDIIQHMIGFQAEEKNEESEIKYKEIKKLLPRVSEKERGNIKNLTYENKLYELTLTVPSNWEMNFIHPQSLVSFQTKDQKAQGRLQVVELSSMTNHAQSLAYQFAKHSGYKYLNGRDVLYEAGYGYLGRFIGLSGRGSLMEFRLFTTVRRGKGFVLLCGAPPDKIESYILDLERIMRSLNFT